MRHDMSQSTEVDREFDLIDELKSALEEIEQKIGESQTETLREKVSYVRFLVDDLDDVLCGEYAPLRRQRFIVKKTDQP